MLPGVIDADYQGITHVMVWTPNPPLQIPEGDKIGQLIPFQSLVPKATNRPRGTGGFGPTGSPQIHLAMDIKNSKPQCKVLLTWRDGSTCELAMLVDTGADVTIIGIINWPKKWPIKNAETGIGGVGGQQNTWISADIVSCRLLDGSQCTVRPYVMPIPLNLLGRDVLSQLGATLVTKSPF